MLEYHKETIDSLTALEAAISNVRKLIMQNVIKIYCDKYHARIFKPVDRKLTVQYLPFNGRITYDFDTYKYVITGDLDLLITLQAMEKEKQLYFTRDTKAFFEYLAIRVEGVDWRLYQFVKGYPQD